MLSVQRVIKDCEVKGVIKDFRKLINHPKLKPDTQQKLKYLYRADEEVKKLKVNRPQYSQESHVYEIET